MRQPDGRRALRADPTRHADIGEILATYNRTGSVEAAVADLEARGLYATKNEICEAARRAGVLKASGTLNRETKPDTRYATDEGRPLRNAREAAGLSQRELATAAGVSQALISQLERIKGFPVRIERARAIADALEAPVGELFTFRPPQDHERGLRQGSPGTRTKHRRVREAERFAKDHGLWTTAQVAAHLHVAKRTVNQYEERGELRAVLERDFGFSKPFKFWNPDDVKAFERLRWARRDGRSATFLSPERVLNWACKRELAPDAVERAVLNAKARNKRKATYVAATTPTAPGKSRGRPRIDSAIDSAISEAIAEDPFRSAAMIQRLVTTRCGRHVSLSTVERRLSEIRNRRDRPD